MRTLVSIQAAVSACERDVTKLQESADCECPQAKILSRIFSEYLRSLSTAISTVSIDEMRSMKTSFKEKVGAFDQEFRRRVKELGVSNQSLVKIEQSFERSDTDLKRAHSKAVDQPSRKSVFNWSPSSLDRDRQFERMQRLASDQAKLASEAELEFNQILAGHSTTYSRASIMITELASMRRRLNRRIVQETQQIISRVNTSLNTVIKNTIPPLVNHLEQTSPSSGDFGMRLIGLDESLRHIVGPDREIRIRGMQLKPQMIEYRAVQSYMAKEVGELSFNRNDRIEVTKKDPSGWWTGKSPSGDTGVFPCVLVAQRPAGAALPLQQIPANTYRPNLARSTNDGTWDSIGSVDDRQNLIGSHAPFTFIGIVQFAYRDECICVEVGDIVQIERMGDSKGTVIVKTHNGRMGAVPLKILSIKQRDENGSLRKSEPDLSRLINW